MTSKSANLDSLSSLENTVKTLEASLNYTQSSMCGTVTQSMQMVTAMNSMMEELLLNSIHIDIKPLFGYEKGSVEMPVVRITLRNTGSLFLNDVSYSLSMITGEDHNICKFYRVRREQNGETNPENHDSEEYTPGKFSLLPDESKTDFFEIDILNKSVNQFNIGLMIQIPSPASANVLKREVKSMIGFLHQSKCLLEPKDRDVSECCKMYSINGNLFRTAFSISPVLPISDNQQFTFQFKDGDKCSFVLVTDEVPKTKEDVTVKITKGSCPRRAAMLVKEIKNMAI